MSLFCCPLCGGILHAEAGALRCENRHSFDIASEGYTHLLPANRMHSKTPGDDRGMVAARRRFLEAGYYDVFAKALCDLVCAETAANKTPALLDVGCGEGYYTGKMCAALPKASVAGFDISKAAVRAAAKKYQNAEFAVASIFAIPAQSERFDCITNVFAPAVPAEFLRVLKKGGSFIYAVPGARHLFGMKEILYREPYENEVKEVCYQGFTLRRRLPVRTTIHIDTAEQVMALFSMTPYYWNTPRDGAARLEKCEALNTEIAFDFLVYQKD